MDYDVIGSFGGHLGSTNPIWPPKIPENAKITKNRTKN